MGKKVDILESIDNIANISSRLAKEKKELARYDNEGYLNGSECEPWITIVIGNHPTYLNDFKVGIEDIELRAIVVEVALKQSKELIKKLTAKLKRVIT